MINKVLHNVFYELYGEGSGTVSPSRWQVVEGVLRQTFDPSLSLNESILAAREHLLRSHLYAEAIQLEGRSRGRDYLVGAYQVSEIVAEKSRLGAIVLTPFCAQYPPRLLANLGNAAPPLLYCTSVPTMGRFVAGVGCRQPEAWALESALAYSSLLKGHSLRLVSGGATGCDSAFEPHVDILPHGLYQSTRHQTSQRAGHHLRSDESIDCGDPASHAEIDPQCGSDPALGVEPYCFQKTNPSATPTRMSPFPHSAVFTGQLAMMRNRIIYAFGEATIIFSARFKIGGTWNGAVQAIRSKRQLFIVEPPCSAAPTHLRAFRALVALGARPLPCVPCERSIDNLWEVGSLEIVPGQDPRERTRVGLPDLQSQQALVFEQRAHV